MGLATPTKGHTKKEEIDTISAYAVTFREKYQVSFYMLMQENRNSADMDRRKAELTECTAEDIKDLTKNLLINLGFTKIIIIFVSV